MGAPTNFPFGLTAGGVPTQGVASIPFTSGNVWFVNSNTGVDGNSGSFLQPLKTTARAIVLAAAGDVIVWMAGHAENIAAAGGITVNKAGLTFWGIGEGKNAPTFTSITSTAATFLISSANTVIGGNVNTVCNIASQVTFFSIAAANVTIGSLIAPITHYDTSSTVGAITYITGSAAAAQLNVFVDYNGFTASSIGTAMISLVGAVNGNIWVDAYGAWSTAVVNFITTACTNISIAGLFYNFNTAVTKDVVDTIGGSTWTVQGYDGVGGFSFDGGSGKTPISNDAASGIAVIQKSAKSSQVGVLTTGMTLFTIAGGPIELIDIMSICTTGGDATAATVLYTTIPTGLSAVPISTASGSIANAPVNATITYPGTGSAAALSYNAGGTFLRASTAAGSTVIIPPGVINATIGSGPTVTGTWAHYLRYNPMGPAVTVS
jgi:hypothetical protein